MDRNDMPIGFTMALAMNPDAMQKFALLSDDNKQKIISGTHGISSRDEMQRYVNAIVTDKNSDIK